MTGGPLVAVLASVDATKVRDAPLLDVAGRPALQLLLQRFAALRTLLDATVVVATTDRPIDDPVVEVAEAAGARTVRARHGDALGALAVAMVRYPAAEVVHLRGHHPFHDPYVVLAAVDRHRAVGADLTTNLLPRSYPRGLDVEVLSPAAIRTAELEVVDDGDRADATAFVRAHPERFRFAHLHSGHSVAAERWTLESPADLSRVGEIASALRDPVGASWNHILSVVGRKVRTRPGQVVLHPQPGPDPGTVPWAQRWTVIVDGHEEGTAVVTTIDGTIRRLVDVPTHLEEPTQDALFALLADL